MDINKLIDVIYSDDYSQTDVSIMTLDEWVMFAKLVQSFKELGEAKRSIIPGRVGILLRDAGVCDRDTFNKLLETGWHHSSQIIDGDAIRRSRETNYEGWGEPTGYGRNYDGWGQ